MSLREMLRSTVARCTYQQMQHATSALANATAHATMAQQIATYPQRTVTPCATACATVVQPDSELCATPTESAGVKGCIPQYGVLTAHRLEKKLIEAAMRRCDEFGDGEYARRDMREQCLSLPPHLQIDLLEHFLGKRPIFKTGEETEARL